MTQSEAILNYLRQGKSLTPLLALDLFGCFRLGARIWDLKHQGHSIEMKLVESPEGKHYAEYTLVQNRFSLEEK